MRLFTEYAALIAMTFLWNWYYELGSSFSALDSIHPDLTNACSLFNIRVDFLGDMVRSSSYSFILRYFCKYEKVTRVPVEYITHFQEFIKDLKCLEYFHKYLTHTNNEHLESVLTNFILEISGDIVNHRQSEVIHVPQELEAVFQTFKKTRSFRTLKSQLRIASEVEALGLRNYD